MNKLLRAMFLTASLAFADCHLRAQDTTPPTILRSSGDATFLAVIVEFSETVADSALDPANYALTNSTLNQNVAISGVARVSDSKVALTTGRLTEGTAYTLTVNNVQDTADPANTIGANSRSSFKGFVFMKGYFEHNFYTSGGSPESLLNDPNYPDNPTFRTFEPLFEYPPDGTDGVGSNYRNGLFGWFLPPQTGNYVFFIASDNQGRLYLSTDEDRINRHIIAEETSQSDPRRWVNTALSDPASKRSDQYANTEWPEGNTIRLESGKRYFIEVLHSEGGEGDQVGVTFIMAGQPDPADFSPPALGGTNVGLYLDPTPVSITFTQQPQNQMVFANSPATFSAGVSGYTAGGYPGLVHFQWQKASAGGEFADISGASGATKTSYTTPPLVAVDDQTRYRVVVTAPGLATNSAVAIATVVTDSDLPRVISAMRKFTNDTQVTVVFSELVTAATANAAGNYTVNGATVSSAVLAPDGKTVLLTVSPGFARGTAKTLSVTGVQDLAGNSIQANSQTAISFQRGALFIEGNAGTLPIVPNAGSAAFINRLIGRGYYVKVLSSTTDAADGSSATGLDLIAISSTVGSGNVDNTYSGVAIPVINWEGNLVDNFGFAGEEADLPTQHAATPALTEIEIVDSSHPLAAGFPAGPVTIFTSPRPAHWVVPDPPLPGLISVAADPSDLSHPVLYAFDTGAELAWVSYTGVANAPARRVIVPLEDTSAADLTEAGWKLIDAAVDWAQNIAPVQLEPHITSVSLANGTISIRWANGGTLQSTSSLTPPVTWTNEAGTDSFSAAAVGSAKFYRVRR